MKQTSGDKGAPLLAVKVGAVEPFFAHVSGEVLTWVTLFVDGERALPAQKREKLQGVNLFLHFSRETLRDWSSQGDTYIIT